MPRNFSLPLIYPIIDVSLIPLTDVEKTALALIEGGAQIIQLRAKDVSGRDFFEAALIIRQATKKSGALFIVNDRVDAAMMAEADGVHIGQDDLPVKEARRLLGKDRIIGYSTHNVREAAEAARLSVDYISFGPVFHTITKKDAQIPKGLRGLSEARKAVSMPIVAIGGITERNLVGALNEGADSVAMISEILTADNIPDKVRRLIRIAKDVKR